jgi:hypothetical protein
MFIHLGYLIKRALQLCTGLWQIKFTNENFPPFPIPNDLTKQAQNHPHANFSIGIFGKSELSFPHHHRLQTHKHTTQSQLLYGLDSPTIRR